MTKDNMCIDFGVIFDVFVKNKIKAYERKTNIIKYFNGYSCFYR